MRIVPIAGRTGRSVALALAVALAAGCDAGLDAGTDTDAPDAADGPGAAGTPPTTLPPPVAGPDAQPDVDVTPGPLPVPAPAPGPDDGTDPDGAATVPSRFQGRYASGQAACDAAGDPSRLQIEAGAIRFHESSGPVTAVDSGPSEVTITAELTGEGETREATYRFRLSDDGRTLTDLGTGMERVRCN